MAGLLGSPPGSSQPLSVPLPLVTSSSLVRSAESGQSAVSPSSAYSKPSCAGCPIMPLQSTSPSYDGYSSLGSHEDSGPSVPPRSTRQPNGGSGSPNPSVYSPLPVTHIPSVAMNSTSANLKAETRITQSASTVESWADVCSKRTCALFLL
ncbi:hypothetical protein Nepgr_032706 [Nepenthes gracilis]|uniref:Uncharacterized protein n=1 Tax=Nepenthes gracilis TaxID=150966 RepID=A0AAD3TKY9_NEPGR|nr:hypothetical protein Nepgr_032706 [Nepenthes gracilis]